MLHQHPVKELEPHASSPVWCSASVTGSSFQAATCAPHGPPCGCLFLAPGGPALPGPHGPWLCSSLRLWGMVHPSLQAANLLTDSIIQGMLAASGLLCKTPHSTHPQHLVSAPTVIGCTVCRRTASGTDPVLFQGRVRACRQGAHLHQSRCHPHQPPASPHGLPQLRPSACAVAPPAGHQVQGAKGSSSHCVAIGRPLHAAAGLCDQIEAPGVCVLLERNEG